MLALGERPEAPATGMRLEKIHQVILHWENTSGSPCADAAFPLMRERTTRGVTHIRSVWGFTCKLSWADGAALQTAERHWLFAVNVRTSINCQSWGTFPSCLTVYFLVVSEKLNICYQRELLVLCFLRATIHLSRDTGLARPFPLQSDRTWITVHTPTDLLLSVQFPLCRHFNLLPSHAVHDLQALVHPHYPPFLQPHSSFVDGK